MEDALQEVLDNVNVVNNTYVVERTTSKRYQSKSHFEEFAERLTKELVKTIGDIVEDTINPKNKH